MHGLAASDSTQRDHQSERLHVFCLSNLTRLIIPEGVTRISYSAFSYCSSLDSIVIPDGVTNIGDFGFYGSGLTSIYFEGNPPAADTNAFGTFSGTV